MNVSVICPVYNTASSLLEAAVRSVMMQIGDHKLELILVDDCSTRVETLDSLKRAVADSRVVVLRKARNGGPGAARSAGVAAAQYPWIGFIDSDDLWPEDKLNLAEAARAERPDTRWIAGNYATLRPNGDLQVGPHLSDILGKFDTGSASSRISTPHLTRGLIADWLPLGASLLDKSLIDEAGGFDSRLIYGEDWLLCLRVSTVAPMDYITSETYVLRRQGTSMMRSPGRMSALLAHSGHLARRDKRLRFIRRELRWFQYATFKDIAMNSALNGQKLKGFAYALRAFAVDPREISDLLLFTRHLSVSGPPLAKGLRKYSKAEQVILNQLSSFDDLVRDDAQS